MRSSMKWVMKRISEHSAKGKIFHYSHDIPGPATYYCSAALAQNPRRYDQVSGLTPEETAVLEKEYSSRWAQPKIMYITIVMCSACAAVQGMGASQLCVVLIILGQFC